MKNKLKKKPLEFSWRNLPRKKKKIAKKLLNKVLKTDYLKNYETEKVKSKYSIYYHLDKKNHGISIFYDSFKRINYMYQGQPKGFGLISQTFCL
jgi:hypothetical protein